MAASNSLFDSSDRFSGSSYPMNTQPESSVSNEDIAEIEGLREVDMAINFGTILAANGLWQEKTTWRFRIKDVLFSVNPYVCWSLSLDSQLQRSELHQAGDSRVGNWHTNCQHSILCTVLYCIPGDSQTNIRKPLLAYKSSTLHREHECFRRGFKTHLFSLC